MLVAKDFAVILFTTHKKASLNDFNEAWYI